MVSSLVGATPQLFDLPGGWSWRSLRNLTASYFSGKRPRGGVSGIREGVLSLGGEHLRWDGTVDLTTPRRIPQSFADSMAGAELALEDILIVKDGATTGKTAFVRSLPERAFVNEHVFVLRPTSEVDAQYLFYWLWSRPGFQQIMLDFRGAAQGGIGRTFVDRVSVALPPIETQRRIVARIDELFAELDDGEVALARAQGELEIYRKALLKAAVTGELTADWRAANRPKETGTDLLQRILTERRERWNTEQTVRGKQYKEPGGPDAADLPELPEEWVWASAEQLAQVSGGITKSAKRAQQPMTLPYLRVGNVYAGRLDLERIETIGVSAGELERVNLAEGDVLIVEGNGSIDQIGRSAVWRGAINPCVHQNHLIKVRPTLRTLSDFIQLWLQSPLGRKELERRASSTSGLHTLSISKIEALRCPLPPASEIATIIREVQAGLLAHGKACNDRADACVDSATLRQSILAAAFRGELVQ